MKITFHLRACRAHEVETTGTVAGEVLTINGVDYDLSAVPEGGLATPEGDHPFVGAITRQGGELSLGVVWFYNEDTSVPVQPSVPPVVTVASGEIPDPIIRVEDAGQEAEA